MLWSLFFTKKLKEEEIKFFKKIINDNPNGRWATIIAKSTPRGFHLSGGMAVRNYFRTQGYAEDKLGIENLDNVYVSVVEQAILMLPDFYPDKN